LWVDLLYLVKCNFSLLNACHCHQSNLIFVRTQLLGTGHDSEAQTIQ
jgi:hypothetical protein